MSTESIVGTHHSNTLSGNLLELDRERGGPRFAFDAKKKESAALVFVAIFEAIVVIVLQSIIFSKFNGSVFTEQSGGQGIPVYLMIFIFSQVYQVLISWDAVRKQNTVQVIAFVLFNLCCFVYAVFQFQQLSKALESDEGDQTLGDQLNNLVTKLLIANAVVIGVCQLFYFYIGARLYQIFGWSIFGMLGADSEIRSMYRWYQILLTILKIDMFFFLGYSIQYLVFILHAGDVEYPLTIIALPLTCLFLALAVYAVKHESRSLMMVEFVGLAAGCAYFIFKIYRIYDPREGDKYANVYKFLTFFASVSLALLVCTIVNVAVCWSNFDKGLKAHLLRDSHHKAFNGASGERNFSLDD